MVIKLKAMIRLFDEKKINLEAVVQGEKVKQDFYPVNKRRYLYHRAIYLAAKELVKLGYYNKALIYLNELIKQSPSIRPLCTRASVYLLLKDRVNAKKDCIELLRLTREDNFSNQMEF